MACNNKARPATTLTSIPSKISGPLWCHGTMVGKGSHKPEGHRKHLAIKRKSRKVRLRGSLWSSSLGGCPSIKVSMQQHLFTLANTGAYHSCVMQDHLMVGELPLGWGSSHLFRLVHLDVRKTAKKLKMKFCFLLLLKSREWRPTQRSSHTTFDRSCILTTIASGIVLW